MILSPVLAAAGGFWAPIANPLAAVLAFFYDLVPNYGIAIVLLTILMMIVLTPLTIKQTRSMLVMQKLQPEMKKLQEQHKNDRQALNEAVMALYKEHNASPLGGCLPMLLPFPLFIGLLRVLEGLSHTVTTTVNGHKVVTAVPRYLTSNTRMYKDIVAAHGQLDAFGMNLAKSARNIGGGLGHSLPYFVLLLIMVGTQFYQQYQLTSKNPAAVSQPGQAMMMKVIPLVFGFISLNFPAGVVLYWTVSNIIRIGQQWALYRYDPKVKSLVAKDVKEIEAKTREIDARDSKAKGSDARAKASDTNPKASGRPRFRDLLINASEAAAERRNPGGKNAPKPGAKPGSEKGGTPPRGGTRGPAGKAPPATSGVNKSQRPAASGGKGAAGAKRVSQKPGVVAPSKPGTTGSSGSSGSSGSKAPSKPGAGRSGASKPGLAKASGAKPGGAGGVAPGAGQKSGGPAGGAKPGTPTKPITPSKAASPGAAPAPPPPVIPAEGSGSGAGIGGNGGGATSGNGAAKIAGKGASGNGAPAEGAQAMIASEGTDAAEAGTAAGAGARGSGSPQGRTGGGSARNASNSRRRRKGR